MDTRPIGVFDSGMGGLTCVRQMISLLPGEDIVYFGDTGRVPYGGRSVETIILASRRVQAAEVGLDVGHAHPKVSAHRVALQRLAVDRAAGARLSALSIDSVRRTPWRGSSSGGWA